MKTDSQEIKNPRVVITGLGVISNLGFGWEEFWVNLLEGKSGITKVSAFDTSDYFCRFAGEIKNFEAKKFIEEKKTRQIGRASQMAIAAAKLALSDAKLNSKDLSKFKMGVSIGTTMGESQVLEIMNRSLTFNGSNSVDVNMISRYLPGSIPASVARELKLIGNNCIFSNACAAGNYAVSYSYDLIKSGKLNLMIAGGVDALSRIAFTGFNRLFVMSPELCQPFDRNRKGMIIGEGAGMLLLETLESARKRKAKIYAEVLGYGLSCDARHMTNPSVQGITKSIKRSLVIAGIKEDKVDYISAHGTGTKENDKAESQAINNVFDKNSKKIPMSSIKSMLGHTMGAAAALESITCCLAINKNFIPPTINFKNKDPECDIDCVPNKSRKHKVIVALNNSQAFGGNNACVVFQKL